MFIPLASRKVPYQLLFIFVLLALVISAMGYIYYEGQKRQIEKEKQNELAAIAALKVGQIVNWRRERMGDAAIIFEDVFLASHLLSLVQNSKQTDKDGILKWMTSFKETYQYENILLLDKNGKILVSAIKENEDIGPNAKGMLSNVAETKKFIFSDLYLNKVSNNVAMDLIVPILAKKGRSSFVVGAILLRINPNDFLYPLIQTWPTPSLTAETALIRREGDKVLYLNTLRYRQNSALALRLPVSDMHLTAAAAALGREGNFEGKDYRGMEVLASIRKIPDVPWSIIAEIDKKEVFAQLRGRLWSVMILIVVSIISAGAWVLLLWRKQEAEAQGTYLLYLEDTVKERTKDLEKANKKLKESYADMESFSYSASHELREPLLIIELSARNLLKKYADRLDDDAKEILSEMKGQTGKMSELIKNLLSFSRASTKEISKSDVNMEALVQSAVEELQATLGNRNVQFERLDLPAAWGDPPMIRQVMLNLLSNALKFTRSKEKAVIEIGGTMKEDENIYYVRDNGAGFAQEHAEKLFGLFSRLSSSKEIEGTGVGLVIAKRIISKHHGGIWAEGKVGEGATFFFSLPRSNSLNSG